MSSASGKYRVITSVVLGIVVLGLSAWALSSEMSDDPVRASAHPSRSVLGAQESSAPADGSIASLVVTGAPLPTEHSFDITGYLGRPLYEVSNETSEVALTFDDGPSRRTTMLIVRILRRHHVHATFFFIGDRSVRGPGPAIVRDVAANGEDIGNHTWTHADLKNLSAQGVYDEIVPAQSALASIDGALPTFVRPRGGKIDATGLAEATRLGLIVTLWSVDGYDIGSATPKKIVYRATHDAKAGSIIGLHDRNPNTILALPEILKRLRKKGLHVVTLSQLLADSTPSWVVPASFSTEDVWGKRVHR